MGMHYAVAFMRDEPHWLLSEPDALAYARYCHNALRHLPVSVAQKYVDFAALGGAFVLYTGGRIVRSAQLAGFGGVPQGSSTGSRRPPGPPPGGSAQVFVFTPNAAQAGPEGELEPELPLNPAPPPGAPSPAA